MARISALMMAAPAALLLACGGGGDLLLPGAGDPAAVTVLQGDQQNGRVGQQLPQPLIVSVTDGSGRPVAGASVVFVFTDGGAGATIDPDTAVTAADGTASAAVVLGTQPGTLHGEARALGANGTPSAKAPFTLTAIPADANGIAAVSGDNQSATVGTPLPDSLVVGVADAFGNPIAGVDVSWTTDGGGSVSAGTTTTGPDGRAAVQRVLGPNAGTQRTLASAAGLAGSPVVFVHTATSGSAQGVSVVSGNAQTGPVSTELPQPLVVKVLDAGNNPVAGVAVAWVVRTGGGSVTPGTSTTDAQGQATASWTMGGTPGSNTLSAVVSGIGVAEFSATAVAGAPARLTVRTQPSATATSGVQLTTQPVIQLLDAQGNEAHQGGVEVRVAIASGGGTLVGTTSRRTDANGRAAFTDLAIRGDPGTRTLRFSADNFASVTSAPITVVAMATTTQITSDDPDPSEAGADVTVRFSVTAAGGTPGGSVRVHDGGDACTGALTDGKGSCTIRLTQTGARTLTADYAATGGFAASSDTEPHQVNAPLPPTLAVAQQPPATATLGEPLNPQPVIQLKAGDGSNLTTAGVAVSVAIGSGGGTLSGTTTRTTDGTGRATFTDLAISGDPGTRTLSFTASGYTGVTSSGIDVEPAPPDAGQSSVTASPDTITAGVGTSSVTVTVRSAGGVPLAGRSVTLASTGTGYTIGPAPTGTTGPDGVATFSFTSTVPATDTLTATSDGVTLGSAQVTVEAVPTTTTIIGDAPDPSVERTAIQVAFNVTAAVGTPTGDVTVASDRENSTCTVAASAGACSLELKTKGTHILTASFRGTDQFADSSDSTTHEVVAGGHGHGG